MYNRQFMKIAQNQIETQILAMPVDYTSFDFYTSFEQNHPREYEQFLRLYTVRGHDRDHAVQIVNSQLMHTVHDRFPHLTQKVETIPNPKGGDMSRWVRPTRY